MKRNERNGESEISEGGKQDDWKRKFLAVSDCEMIIIMHILNVLIHNNKTANETRCVKQ